MKCFCAILVIAAAIQFASAGEEMKAKMMEIGKKCGEKFGISEEMYQEFMSGDRSKVDDQKKCVAKCFLEDLGIVDSSVNILEGNVKELLKGAPPEKVQTVAECSKITHAEPCEKAYQMVMCVMKLKM